MDILDKIDNLLTEIEGTIGLYKPRKVAHGRVKSQASRKQGMDRLEYIKKLKQNKKEYRRDKNLQRITKKKAKKYRKKAAYKRNVQIYKSLHGGK